MDKILGDPTLQDLVRQKMKADGLSLRKAGDQADVAHTTIDRALKGETLDLETLEKVCDWVGIPVTTVLGIGEGDKKRTLDLVASALALCPELSEVFEEISRRVVAGEIKQKILDEVAAFASYRLSIHMGYSIVFDGDRPQLVLKSD